MYRLPLWYWIRAIFISFICSFCLKMSETWRKVIFIYEFFCLCGLVRRRFGYFVCRRGLPEYWLNLTCNSQGKESFVKIIIFTLPCIGTHFWHNNVHTSGIAMIIFSCIRIRRRTNSHGVRSAAKIKIDLTLYSSSSATRDVPRFFLAKSVRLSTRHREHVSSHRNPIHLWNFILIRNY